MTMELSDFLADLGLYGMALGAMATGYILFVGGGIEKIEEYIVNRFGKNPQEKPNEDSFTKEARKAAARNRSSYFRYE